MIRRLIVKLNKECNNNCRFCIYPDSPAPSRQRSTSSIKRAIQQALTPEVKEIILTGGEPTLRKDIFEIVAFAKRLGLNIQLQTNGRLLAYRYFCKEMISAGVNCFCMALHAHNAPAHDFLTRGKGNFKQIIQAIENLIALKQTTVTNTVITRANYKHLEKIARLLLNLGVDTYQFIYPHVGGQAYINRRSMVVRMKQVAPYVKAALRMGLLNNKAVTVKAMPFCLMKDYESCVRRSIFPDEKYLFFRSSASCSFWKGRTCRSCVYNERCEGVWSEYPRLYGDREFNPVK